MKHVARLALLAFLAASYSLLPAGDAHAKPPICNGSAGSCSWEVGYDGGSEVFYYALECPNGEGAFLIIGLGDALEACSS